MAHLLPDGFRERADSLESVTHPFDGFQGLSIIQNYVYMADRRIDSAKAGIVRRPSAQIPCPLCPKWYPGPGCGGW
jgi:hypothetical protein